MDSLDIFHDGLSEQADPGVVTTLENILHGFESGEHVVFKEVKGMEELNGRQCQVTGTLYCSATL